MADKPTKPPPASPASAPLDPLARSPRGVARNAARLAACLATIAGFVDAYGMITYGVYVSFMSGNTTQTGYQAAEGAYGAALLSALAIPFFVMGSFAGTLLVEFAARLARRRVFGVVAAGLALIVGLTKLGLLSGGGAIAAISFAMGVMNAAFSRVGAESVSLTFVTGTLSRVGSHLALAARRAPLAEAQGPWDTHLEPRPASGAHLGRIPGGRGAVGRGDAAVRGLGSGGAGADPRGAGGVRPPRSRGGLTRFGRIAPASLSI